MRTAIFFDTLPTRFCGDPATSEPTDERWASIAESVGGYTTPNELAVLNLAASLLPPDEAYLEVGTFKGRSLCAAVQGNTESTFVAIENFREFGMDGQEARAELLTNIDTHAENARLSLHDGDAFALIGRAGILDRPVGVYFYDGEHTLLAHYLALAVVEPVLADEALVLVDDASWPLVQRAHRLYLERHPGWSVAARWDATRADDPRWANGLHALVYRRPPGSSRRLSSVDRALLRYQVSVQSRVNKAAWSVARRAPGPVTAAARAVLGRSRAITS